MPPGSTFDLGQSDTLGHLTQHQEQFDWLAREKDKHTYYVQFLGTCHPISWQHGVNSTR
jgi:hypothetical protein